LSRDAREARVSVPGERDSSGETEPVLRDGMELRHGDVRQSTAARRARAESKGAESRGAESKGAESKGTGSRGTWKEV
jgi:hypothetical protein